MKPLVPFEDVVAAHGATVLRVCRALTGPDDAEDAWSETFLAALRAYPELPPGSNVEAWLVTIAKRKVVDEHRRRARRPVPVEQPARVERPDPGAEVPDERAHRLWEALAQLTPARREAVVYHYVAGLPYAEVGRLLDKSEAAARRAAADGIRELRRLHASHELEENR